MTINFFEPGDVPQSPENTRIEHLTATPSEDGWRVKVEIHVTPFLQRPNLEMILSKHDGGNSIQVASFSIVETMHPRMEFTMHVRGVDSPAGQYTLETQLHYRDTPQQGDESLPPTTVHHEKSLQFAIEAGSSAQ